MLIFLRLNLKHIFISISINYEKKVYNINFIIIMLIALFKYNTNNNKIINNILSIFTEIYIVEIIEQQNHHRYHCRLK